jgi:hypothetical protein
MYPGGEVAAGRKPSQSGRACSRRSTVARKKNCIFQGKRLTRRDQLGRVTRSIVASCSQKAAAACQTPALHPSQRTLRPSQDLCSDPVIRGYSSDDRDVGKVAAHDTAEMTHRGMETERPHLLPGFFRRSRCGSCARPGAWNRPACGHSTRLHPRLDATRHRPRTDGARRLVVDQQVQRSIRSPIGDVDLLGLLAP